MKKTAKKWDIVWKDVSDIVPYERNPRRNDQTVPYLVNSIREFGFNVPLVVDSANVVVCGHTRLKAAKEIGMERVPCVVADNLSEDELKAFRIADNKVQEYSKWDFDKLRETLNELDGAFSMKDFGFGEFCSESVDDLFLPENQAQKKDGKSEGGEEGADDGDGEDAGAVFVCPKCGRKCTAEEVGL